ncbi:hypothetical protein SAMN05443529_10752 [Desulfosporosinus hippei DSM 8344]|uniref:Tetratricopeptide repeat-containing protein n=2 Tax=Desulfosporosinus TaxID=79206 RepID=A0A1G7XNZ6_9FIRM|nr:hypothetical protein SAMN05443529_10752 [Desulfosporosinus hippei DSM 8344]
MFARRKRSSRNPWKISILFLVVIFLIFVFGPLIWRIQHMKQARSVYDVSIVQEDLQWIENKGWLNKLPYVKETKLWVALNTGSASLDVTELASYQDEKHHFWLYLYYLPKDGRSAQDVLDKMSEGNLKQLAKALMSISNGKPEESQKLLSGSNLEWKELSIDEQTLRHLIMAQAALIRGDRQTAQAELQAAQQLNPNNPAGLSLAFDEAIGDGQWARAIELSRMIDAQTWRPTNVLYETKKAILAVREGDTISLSKSLSAIEGLHQGDALIKYVNGIKAVTEGDLDEGKELLDQAQKEGLEGELGVDAQKSLNQIVERLKADRSLQKVVAEMNEKW